MITRNSPYFDVSCDGCAVGETQVETDDFYEVVKKIKSEGWTIEKDENEEWQHYCPDCLGG